MTVLIRFFATIHGLLAAMFVGISLLLMGIAGKTAWDALTGDDGLKREGKVDQASGSIKDKVGDGADKVKDALHRD